MSAHDKQADQKRIVTFLAKESHASIADVAILYEHERDELALGARITTFLDIFAIRNVQETLRKRELDKYLVPAESPALLAA